MRGYGAGMSQDYQVSAAAGAGIWRSAANWSAAVVSVSLVIGVAIWGFELVMRDVSGVPVVRAIEGPAREAPDDPGGTQAAYQGLAVNAVAADGEADSVPERIALAPEPLALDLEDMPAAELAALPAPDADASSTADATAEAIARQVARSMAALQESRSGAPTPEVSDAVESSPRPARRPGDDLVGRAAASASSTSAGGSGADVDGDNLDSDSLLVQVGDFGDEDAAREEWDRLTSEFAGAMSGKERVIQQVGTATNPYRLRVHGFEDYAAAEEFCSELQAQSQGCIPVRTQ